METERAVSARETGVGEGFCCAVVCCFGVVVAPSNRAQRTGYTVESETKLTGKAKDNVLLLSARQLKESTISGVIHSIWPDCCYRWNAGRRLLPGTAFYGICLSRSSSESVGGLLVYRVIREES